MKRQIFYFLSAAIFMACGPAKRIAPIALVPIKNTLNADINRKVPPKENELKHWPHMDLISDTLPGMSVDKTYQLLLADRPYEMVIVGVIDSGVDINHEDLKDIIWVNNKEIADNGVDDDHNGYIDDRYGWNFLGESLHEQLEMTRIVQKGDDGSQHYKDAKAAFDKEMEETKKEITNITNFKENFNYADSILIANLGKIDYSIDEARIFLEEETTSSDIKSAAMPLLMIGRSPSELKDYINRGMDYYQGKLDYSLNIDYDGRSVVGDNPDDFTDVKYGDNNVIGPDVDEVLHGTHVAGIIAAKRGNNIGMDGVANHVKIMTIRAVPDGDEYDKDIALSIRYAADNGAKVINTSFGKYFSPHADKVAEAIKYAASKDVLIVNAAGNESKNNDKKTTYPTDIYDGVEIADNMITIGAISPKYGKNMVAVFSNYGKQNVDIFAPGVKIWSTTPKNTYKFLQGTSMASPEVAGVAALIRSYYPRLKASQVKKIIMKSGLNYLGEVYLGEDSDKKETITFADLSKSGKIVNAYNAFILANKVARGLVKL